MRRLITIGALALLVVAVVPFASAGTAVSTRHVDGTVTVFEPAHTDQAGNDVNAREWLARFEVRTTGDVVQFGYLRLVGITDGNNAGELHEHSVYHVDYYRTGTGSPGATLWMDECVVLPWNGCFDDGDVYRVSDGGVTDTFLANLGWSVEAGNISIYTTAGQNSQ